jgi:hypothetical protein
MYRTKLHQTVAEQTIWTGASRELALGTDPDLAEAEDFVYYPEAEK